MQGCNNLFSNLLSYEIVDGDGVYGTNSTGEWTGLIGMAHRNQVDLCVADFRETPERATVVDFTPPLMEFRSEDKISKLHAYVLFAMN